MNEINSFLGSINTKTWNIEVNRFDWIVLKPLPKRHLLSLRIEHEDVCNIINFMENNNFVFFMRGEDYTLFFRGKQ